MVILTFKMHWVVVKDDVTNKSVNILCMFCVVLYVCIVSVHPYRPAVPGRIMTYECLIMCRSPLE